MESSEAIAVIPPDAPLGQADLVLNLEGFGGPIDLLLHLARDQKVDLAKISILQLANQYLDYIERAQNLRLEIAADYLVMAAWLAYLKSRLLLPVHEQPKDEPTGEELASALAWQLKRLEAMQMAASNIIALPQKGVNVFMRGMPDGITTVRKSLVQAEIYDILSAYGAIKKRTTPEQSLHIVKMELFSVENALQRMRAMLGDVPEWSTLQSFLPQADLSTTVGKSAIATTLIASLELAKEGLIEVRQEGRFGPIYIRRKDEQQLPYLREVQ